MGVISKGGIRGGGGGGKKRPGRACQHCDYSPLSKTTIKSIFRQKLCDGYSL